MSEYTEGPWIEHTTGKMPVPGDTMVKWETEAKFSAAPLGPNLASNLSWERPFGPYTRVTRYRVQADEDGWVKHVPGHCPVDGNRAVVVQLRSGMRLNRSEGMINWEEIGNSTVDRYKVTWSGSIGKDADAEPDTTLEALISAAIAYKDATTHQQKALERLNEAVKAFKGK